MSELIELEAAEARISSLLKPNPTTEHAEASFNLGVGYALAAIRSLPTVTRTEAEAPDSDMPRVENRCNHCDKDFVYSYAVTICPDCFMDGHRFSNCGPLCKPSAKSTEGR